MRKPSTYISASIVEEITQTINRKLDKCGLYYRIFARSKSDESIEKKLARKNYNRKNNYLMQDFIGVRIALYFYDDIPICKQIINNHFQVVDESVSKHDSTTFSPVVLNLVCKIPEETLSLIDSQLWDNYLFDKTFEIQIRTIFSEGWHEIDHDIRYKCKHDWDEHKDLDRNLNGILATLETCDWSIVGLIDNLAYREYKCKKWTEMLKNKLRIHLVDIHLRDEILRLFDDDNEIAKQFFRFDRRDLLIHMAGTKGKLPLNANNMVYLINYLFVHNEDISNLTPPAFYTLLA